MPNVFDLIQVVQADITQLQADMNVLMTALQGADLATFLSTLQSVQASIAVTVAQVPANGKPVGP
jgi:hypothetical protein